MKRDNRLILAAVAFIVGLTFFHFYIENSLDWSQAFWTGDWNQYGEKYGFDISGAGKTFDFTAPRNIWQGIVGLVLFGVGILTILIAWWRPNK